MHRRLNGPYRDDRARVERLFPRARSLFIEAFNSSLQPVDLHPESSEPTVCDR